MRLSEGIEVHVIPSEEMKKRARLRLRGLRGPTMALELAAVAASVGVAVVIGGIVSLWLHLPNLSIIFLVAVLFCAARFGARAAVIASFASFAAYNFFFTPPMYSFTIAEPYELFTLLIFLVAAVLTGSLAGRLRDQSEGALKRAEVTQSLYELSRKISGAAKLDDVLWAATSHLHRTLGGGVVLLVPEGGELRPWAAWPLDVALDAGEESAARWAMEKAEAAGWATNTLPKVRFQFRPLVTVRGIVGVCGFEPPSPDAPLSAEVERILTAILDQTAIALDRAMLAGEAVKAATLEENERVRDALLAALSHDLKTPLASITGAVTSLRELGERMSGRERQELLRSRFALI